MDSSDANEPLSSSDPGELLEPRKDCPLEAIYRHRGPYELPHVDKIQRSERHTVLYELPFQAGVDGCPVPLVSSDGPTNGAARVRLPTSAKCVMRNADGTSGIESRWNLVRRALERPITNARQLEAAILLYNPDYRTRYQFVALHRLFEQCDESERAAFFRDTLRRMTELALRLTELFRVPIPLLTQRQNHAVSMSQQQAACLLANAFFCTFPQPKSAQARSFSVANFAALFAGTSQSAVEKLKCLCHYFRRVCCVAMPTGVLTYERRYLPKHALLDWNTVEHVFDRERAPLHVSNEGTIEDQGAGLLQMVFANRFLGGGVIGNGCVQEEIRCVICPELLVGRLLFESLRETEAYFVLGAEQFCTYENYAATFAFADDHRDETPRDASGRRRCYIVGLDALKVLDGTTNQYSERSILRELHKAYVGFRYPLPGPVPGIATGNWGCGAFGGSAPLKALLQLMVGCVTERPLLYFTCNERNLQERLCNLYAFLTERRVPVATVYELLVRYGADDASSHGTSNVYNYLYQSLADSNPRAR
ncbi:AGAP000589-PA-like protein [Anopheles sinensis]|uniref:poly(ADP-ribose) glycohydrolase n=1 Tax=Anopheles sinensis TaxID=74873 RepID=A0A084VAA8_ANOSI|nr:AGAP000589-PA-like protein [Anopheles sinensis]